VAEFVRPPLGTLADFGRSKVQCEKESTVAEPHDPAKLQLALAATADYQQSGGETTDRAAIAPPPPESVSSLIGQRVGQYRIQRELGRGGMGVVYEAVHDKIGQRAALKTLHAELSQSPQFKKRFLNERRAQQRRR
jgi:hypothetical protein